MLLSKVFLGTSLAGMIAWVIDYSLQHGWSNPLGRTLLVKTVILLALLGLSALSLYFSLNFLVLEWAQVILLGFIGPVMVWRMVAFRRVSQATRRCPNGHTVSLLARFCPACGAAVPGAGPGT
jgi:threonine/homoserine/homoserine lactone efflux protein